MNSESLNIHRVDIHLMNMKLVRPFVTSFGTTIDRLFLLVEVIDENGISGWGESVAMEEPWYNEETVRGNLMILKDFLIPELWRQPLDHPRELVERFEPIRRNMMAKSSLEGAVWDLYAKKQGLSLSKALGGDFDRIEVGVSIGIQPSREALLDLIDERMDEGYKRIKIKIKPGKDLDLLEAVRHKYPDVPLMADANSAYSLDDIEHLKAMDQFDLMMIEQPLEHDDIIDHATLQKQLTTPICLDESIHTLADARKALDLGSCGIINIKVGRVGGLSHAKTLHDYCLERQVPLWCGGMLESGVGRAHNIAIASLKGFSLPGDTAGSNNYWVEDIIEPEVIVKNGYVAVPKEAGLGFKISREKLEKYRITQEIIRKG